MHAVRAFPVTNSFDWIRGKSDACCSIIFSFQIDLIQLDEEIMRSVRLFSVVDHFQFTNSFDWIIGKCDACCYFQFVNLFD